MSGARRLCSAATAVAYPTEERHHVHQTYPAFRFISYVSLALTYIICSLTALGTGGIALIFLLDGKPELLIALPAVLVTAGRIALLGRVSYESLIMFADAADCLIEQTLPRK